VHDEIDDSDSSVRLLAGLQFTEQAPGPRGSPQEPQPPAGSAERDGALPELTAKTESSFSSFAP